MVMFRISCLQIGLWAGLFLLAVLSSSFFCFVIVMAFVSILVALPICWGCVICWLTGWLSCWWVAVV